MKIKLFLIVAISIASNSASAFDLVRGDNGYYCWTYQYWWDTRKKSSEVVIEDVTDTKYKVQFLESIYNSKYNEDRDKGDFAWLPKLQIHALRSDCHN